MPRIQRSDRISEEIKKVVAQLIREEIKDPRLPLLTTVTAVEVSRDLAYATVYVSTLGGSAESEQVLEALEHAKGFIRREVGHQVRMRLVPEFRFRYDNSAEIGEQMARFIDKVKADDEALKRNSLAGEEQEAE